ncbi:MAG TPA: hypothetical protein VKR78_03775 [Acidimicrobiales bacterium]|nr:hypothetical protein [Acidimicrobiales bacterium]
MRRSDPGEVRHLTLVVGSGPDEWSDDLDESDELTDAMAEAAEDGVSERQVAAEVAAVLAGATDEVLAAAPLTLPLALSVCMERNDAGIEGLISAMQSLRRAVLAVSGLDVRSEPVPLVTGDPRTAALGLAEYLRGLLCRAARACAAAPDDVASAAAARLA